MKNRKPKNVVTFKTAKRLFSNGFGVIKSTFNAPYYNHLGEYKGDAVHNLKAYLSYKDNKMSKSEYEKYALIPAPTQAEVQEWLRIKHKIHITVNTNNFKLWYCKITTPTDSYVIGKMFKSYETALENALYNKIETI